MPSTDFQNLNRSIARLFAMPVTLTPASTLTTSAVSSLPNMRGTDGRFIGRPNKPTIKQMAMMAQSMSDGLNGFTSNSIFRKIRDLPTLEEYEVMLKTIERYNSFLEKRFAAGVQRLGRRVNSLLQHHFSYTSYSYDDSGAFNQNYDRIRALPRPGRARVRADGMPVIRAGDVMSDLLMIVRNYETYWDSVNKKIVVMTPEIIIKSPTVRGLQYNFGQILMHLSPIGAMPIYTAHTPRLSRRNQLFHPHINTDKKLCFGDGASAAERCRKAGRYFDLLEIIMSVLQNYGNNPYDTIEQWNGVCDTLVDPNTGNQLPMGSEVPPEIQQRVRCVSCASEVAELHACERPNCRHNNSCIACVVRCNHTNCNVYVCHDHVMRCGHCGRSGCSQHFHAHPRNCDACMGWVSGQPVTNNVTF